MKDDSCNKLALADSVVKKSFAESEVKVYIHENAVTQGNDIHVIKRKMNYEKCCYLI
jgi:hypothetical protein